MTSSEETASHASGSELAPNSRRRRRAGTRCPATLGNIARRRGADARFQRTPITTAVPRHAATVSSAKSAEEASAIAGVGADEQEVPVALEEEMADDLDRQLQDHRADEHAVGGRLRPARR